MYPKSNEPQYVPGGSANAAICVFVALLALVLRYVHIWENKKLERAERERTEAGNLDIATPGESDRGRRAAGFRYVY